MFWIFQAKAYQKNIVVSSDASDPCQKLPTRNFCSGIFDRCDFLCVYQGYPEFSGFIVMKKKSEYLVFWHVMLLNLGLRIQYLWTFMHIVSEYAKFAGLGGHVWQIFKMSGEGAWSCWTIFPVRVNQGQCPANRWLKIGRKKLFWNFDYKHWSHTE